MQHKILAIIPARGGSKGLKRKNIYPLLNKPLIAYTIESTLQSDTICDVYVSSEDDEILSVSQKYGAKTHKRPKALAQDTSTSEVVISNLLDAIDESYTHLILLQPTSPLRNEKDIHKAFETFFSSNASALISVTQPTHSPLKAFTCNSEGYLKGVVNDTYPFMPRQELPKCYYPNGAIYIVEVAYFLEHKKLFSPKTIAFEMSEDRSIDIDTIEDIKKIEKILLG